MIGFIVIQKHQIIILLSRRDLLESFDDKLSSRGIISPNVEEVICFLFTECAEDIQHPNIPFLH